MYLLHFSIYHYENYRVYSLHHFSVKNRKENFKFWDYILPFYQVLTSKLGNMRFKSNEIQNSKTCYILNREMVL